MQTPLELTPFVFLSHTHKQRQRGIQTKAVRRDGLSSENA